jgi:hypothetical protein
VRTRFLAAKRNRCVRGAVAFVEQKFGQGNEKVPNVFDETGGLETRNTMRKYLSMAAVYAELYGAYPLLRYIRFKVGEWSDGYKPFKRLLERDAEWGRHFMELPQQEPNEQEDEESLSGSEEEEVDF